MKVAIIGLGLIGGSMARDLSAAGHVVLGWDRSSRTRRDASRAKAIDGVLGRDYRGVESCDVCVVAVPVGDAPAVLARVAPRLSGVRGVTDVGSTKGTISRAASALGLGARFVGSHPIAGDHRSGWRASRTGLFRGGRVILCPQPDSDRMAIASIRRMWRALGASTATMQTAEHDEFAARISHLPQLTSSALAVLLADERIRRASLGPGGRDVTRLAGSAPALWSGIVIDNAPALVPLIRSLRRELAAIETVIRRRDAAAAERWFRRAGRWHTA